MSRIELFLVLIALTFVLSNYAQSEEPAGEHDRLCGWFKVTTESRLIPVFKIDGTYYTVLRRGGFEIPLEQCTDGLQWRRDLPSSMAGTKIGFNDETNEVYISIFDQIREHIDESFTNGEKQPMEAIPKPSWLRDATAEPPRTLDDFLGWYEPVWFPYARGQMRNEGGKYLIDFQLIQTDGEKSSWAPEPNGPRQLTPLAQRLGFTMQREEDLKRASPLQLVYSTTRKRFELQVSSADTKPHVIRMPLARIPSPSPDTGEAPLPPMEIGIPSWD